MLTLLRDKKEIWKTTTMLISNLDFNVIAFLRFIYFNIKLVWKKEKKGDRHTSTLFNFYAKFFSKKHVYFALELMSLAAIFLLIGLHLYF